MSAPLVWLPFDTAHLDDPPASLRYEIVRSLKEPPESAAEVEFCVVPYAVGPVGAGTFDRMPRLKVVQTLTAGVEHIRAAVPPGVTLCNGGGIHDTSTAELALTLILSSLRGIPEFVRAQGAQRWEPTTRPSLADKTVLIVGYGRIGEAIERRLLPFETEVLRVARRARDGVHGLDELGELLPLADVVVLVVPGTPRTRHLVDAGFLARMREGALLINVARGPVVDTDALVFALGEGRISAALDVTDPEPLPSGHPLWSAPNLLLTPHVGGDSKAMWPRTYRVVGAQLARFAAGEPLDNVIDGDY